MTTIDTRRARPSSRRFNRAEIRSIAAMAGAVLVLHVAGWALLSLTISRALGAGSTGVFTVGLGLTAYTLGMRHAFDADHIAAIDNTTRKLLADTPTSRRPLTVGFFFSLGHSTVVFGLCLLLALGVRSVGAGAADDSSTLTQAGGVIGTSVSGGFLLIIGVLNLVVLVGIVSVFREMRHGGFSEAELENHLNNRGLMNRLLRPATNAVRRAWHMYPVGFLFGLGFDTASEVSLLVLAAGATTFTLPWYAVLVLPVLFAAGMSLLDSVDGVFMGLAYDWASQRPVRKVYYNMTITGLSVAVALMIGGIEIVGLFGDRTGISSGPVAWISAINLDYVGYAIVALFVATWAVAFVVWRVARVEERWTEGLAQGAQR